MNLEYNNILIYIIKMFCKICQNFMDITNNIDNNQYGSANKDGENMSSSSDYDVSESSSEINHIDIDKLLLNIFGNNDIETLKSVNIDELIKNPIFNKLPNNHKNIIINKINEKSKSELGIISKSTDSVVSKECYFYCKTCGYYEIIPDRTFIFSRGNEKKDDIYNFNFINYKNDSTLPNTKKYTCINDKCSTHKEPKLKNAVFYRQKGSYTTRYICTVCDSFWNTFIEK